MKVHLCREEWWPVFTEIDNEKYADLTVEMTDAEYKEFKATVETFSAIQKKYHDMFYGGEKT